MDEKHLHLEQVAELPPLLRAGAGAAVGRAGLESSLSRKSFGTLLSGYVLLLMIGDLKWGFCVTFALLSSTSPRREQGLNSFLSEAARLLLGIWSVMGSGLGNTRRDG